MYLFLYVLWLILNGKLTLEVCTLGAAVTILMSFVCFALFGYTPNSELRLYRRGGIGIAYMFVLLWEIVKANCNVISVILFRRRRIEPCLVTFQVDLKQPFSRFILANSITLTPGTITVHTDESSFVVHCMSREMLEGIEDGIFVRLLKKMEACV